MIRSEKYLFGAAAVGMVVATALIFNIPVSASSADDTDLVSYSMEAEIASETQVRSVSNATNRQVRVIHPSPYQNNAPRGVSIAGTH